MEKYNPSKIEKKWQNEWEELGIYKNYSKEKKFYALDMFPYPSGAGLHVGHPKGYIATDVFSRYKMLCGYSVLHPMGWDAFGLPAENYALKMKMHPRAAVEQNIATFKKQLEAFGFTYDWDREVNTTDPKYYKWTQWTFLKMLEKGLAYESNEPVNWCPSCKTVLSNEDLENGLCERCGTQVIQRRLRQWVLKMTEYADRLLYDLDSDELDWEDSIITQQKNWIGRSEGAQFEMQIKGTNEKIEVYTTRLDTAFGITYAVVAPEHEIIGKLKNQIKNFPEIEKYLISAQNKTILERTELQKEKTGVKMEGIEVVNPFTEEAVPVYVADYVLGGYGTGAVMAVPAHDERDFEFAKKYDLPIKQVVAPYLKDNPRADKETEKRDVVVAIIRNPKDNTYLCLNWKTTEWKSFPSGGTDGGDVIDAAMREAHEETGYKNFRFIRQIGDSIFAEFYRPHKGSNVFANFKYYLFELENEERDEINQKEKDQHESVWIKEEDVENFLNVLNQKIAWRKCRGGDFAYCEDGILINSSDYSGLFSEEAREKMVQWLEKEGIGKRKVNYKMRDWIFSRQKYWGEPIPVVHCEKCGTVAVPEDQLPVTLPEVDSYESTDTGESPLASILEWVNTECPKCGGPAKRETNTMPQWAGSSWYYLRYIDPKNNGKLIDSDLEKEWMPVDLYVGGAEHATRHLLYARFWHKFLQDIGVVSTSEPFKKLVHVGLIQAEDGRKMSKRWNNVINPDDMIAEFGADALRLYEMFMGPFTQNIAWSTEGVKGVRKFLDKIWRNYEKVDVDKVADGKPLSMLHKTISKVTSDIENFRFNTAISQMMIFTNFLDKEEKISKDIYGALLQILAPFAPHISDELWNKMGNNESIFNSEWPKFEHEFARDEEIEMAVQVNGKLRDTITVALDVTEDEAKETALESKKVQAHTEGKEIAKIIFVPKRLINIVVK